MFRCLVNTLSRFSQRAFVVTRSIWIFGSWEPNIRLPSIPKLRYVKETALLSHYFQGFSPHSIPKSSIFWQWFNHEFFNCSLRIQRSRSLWAVLFSTSASYMGSGGRITLSGGSQRRISTEMPSLAIIANFSMICHRSHRNAGSSVGFSQKGSIPRSARSLVADCAMWYPWP